MPNDADPQKIAEETSAQVQPEDPRTEPPNSTVDDWFGQRVQRDADRLEAPTAGDEHPTSEAQAQGNRELDPPA